MRRAGLGAGDLNADCFRSPRKGSRAEGDSARLPGGTRSSTWIDRAGVLHLAIERLRTGFSRTRQECAGAHSREHRCDRPRAPTPRRLAGSIGESTSTWTTRGQATDDESPAPSDARLLRLVRSARECTRPKAMAQPCCSGRSAKSTRFARCFVAAWKDEIPLDQVEVLCTDVKHVRSLDLRDVRTARAGRARRSTRFP